MEVTAEIEEAYKQPATSISEFLRCIGEVYPFLPACEWSGPVTSQHGTEYFDFCLGKEKPVRIAFDPVDKLVGDLYPVGGNTAGLIDDCFRVRGAER